MKRFVIALAVVVWGGSGVRAELAPLNLGPDLNVGSMASLLVGRGVTISNVQYTGATNASGTFCGGEEAIGFDVGVLLTSGSTGVIVGPNDSDSAGTSNGTVGDSSLDALIPGFETFDAAVLEFDFVPVGSTVQFQYVFGSEEYNEFVNSPFNDVFGFFVNGVNYALIPDTQTPVSINNVNNGHSSGVSTGPCNNCAFYIDNVGTNGVRNTQLDGLTTVLTFTAPVNPGQVNHMKIAIADAGDGILDSAVFIQAGSLSSVLGETNLVTRDAKFWFTHPYPSAQNCVNLRDAIQASFAVSCTGLGLDLGFMQLPTGFRNDDNVRDAEDAVIEALGFYWRKPSLTGELGGSQSLKLRGSRLCRERKSFAVEYIAALANVSLFGTPPAMMTYNDGKSLTNFPATLLEDARAAAADDDVVAIVQYKALLNKFNKSGLTNQFPSPLFECNEQAKKQLKSLARDPTTASTCPGQNQSCTSAKSVVFSGKPNDIFAKAVFKDKANLTKYTDDVPSPSCGVGGRDAVWKIKPNVGSALRHFTVDTAGSNFDTLISVFEGPCDEALVIACGSGIGSADRAKVGFNTDGTNTYYIVIEGRSGAFGSMKMTVTSP